MGATETNSDLQTILNKIGENGKLITQSEARISDKIETLEKNFNKALQDQEVRHKTEIDQLRNEFEERNDLLTSELDEIRQLIEGRSTNFKFSTKAVQSAIKEVATSEYKKLQNQVSEASEKANSNEQYTRNWCLRIYGAPIQKENVSQKGHVRAAMDAAYGNVIAPILQKLIDKGNCVFTELPDVSRVIENCHTIGKELVKDGKSLPPPIIVRFMKREIRDLVIKNRKFLPKPDENLTKAGIDKFKIVEDLTQINHARLIGLIKDTRVEKVWSIQGKFRLILADDPLKKVINCQGTNVDVKQLVDDMKEK